MITFHITDVGYDHGMTVEDLGFLPYFFSEDDPRPAAEQLNEKYAHGGGVRDIARFVFNAVDYTIQYPGDPAMEPFAISQLRNERLYFYDSAWLAIVQDDGSKIVTRVD